MAHFIRCKKNLSKKKPNFCASKNKLLIQNLSTGLNLCLLSLVRLGHFQADNRTSSNGKKIKKFVHELGRTVQRIIQYLHSCYLGARDTRMFHKCVHNSRHRGVMRRTCLAWPRRTTLCGAPGTAATCAQEVL